MGNFMSTVTGRILKWLKMGFSSSKLAPKYNPKVLEQNIQWLTFRLPGFEPSNRFLKVAKLVSRIMYQLYTKLMLEGASIYRLSGSLKVKKLESIENLKILIFKNKQQFS